MKTLRRFRAPCWSAWGEIFDEAKLQAMNVGNLVFCAHGDAAFRYEQCETMAQVHGALLSTANRRIRPKCYRPTLRPEQRQKQNGNSGLKDSGLLAIVQRHESRLTSGPSYCQRLRSRTYRQGVRS